MPLIYCTISLAPIFFRFIYCHSIFSQNFKNFSFSVWATTGSTLRNYSWQSQCSIWEVGLEPRLAKYKRMPLSLYYHSGSKCSKMLKIYIYLLDKITTWPKKYFLIDELDFAFNLISLVFHYGVKYEKTVEL